MAVVRIVLEERRLIHHRNPSGFKNKVRYLLSESKRDFIKLNHIMDYEICYFNCDKNNWDRAYNIATKLIITGGSI